MGRIYFDTKTDRVEVEGWERAFMSSHVTDACLMAIGAIWSDAWHVWKGLAQMQSWYKFDEKPDQAERERMCMSLCKLYNVGHGDKFVDAHGDEHSWHTMALNTAMRTQNPMVQLAARISGQCEIHCFVRGKNKAWLADLLEASIVAGYLRLTDYKEEKRGETQGWLAVIRLLRKNDTEDVVLSYSVCNSFTHDPDVFDWEEDEELKAKCDEWRTDEDNDPDDEIQMKAEIMEGLDDVWERSFAALNPTLELDPDNFAMYFFGDGKTIHDLDALFTKPASADSKIAEVVENKKKRRMEDGGENGRPAKRQKRETLEQMQIDELCALMIRHNPSFKDPNATLHGLEDNLRYVFDTMKPELDVKSVNRGEMWKTWEAQWAKGRAKRLADDEAHEKNPSARTAIVFREGDRRERRMFESATLGRKG